MKTKCIILIILLTYSLTFAENIRKQLFIEDMDNNNGYVAIILDEVKLTENYIKVLHLVNITEYEKTINNIGINIDIIKNGNFNNPLFSTINQNYLHLRQKIINLRPHIRSKRGLFNFAGNALSFLAATMDSNDEKEIRETLATIKLNNKKFVSENNKQIKINRNLMEQINNVSIHIQNQQNNIKQQLDRYVLNFVDVRFNNLENQISFMENVYQIDYDLNLLRNHVDDMEQVILSSKLGILTKNILNDNDLRYINNFNVLSNIKIVVMSFNEDIVITIMIPKYSEKPFYKYY